MALMHPIEIADGGHTAAMRVAQIVNAANQSHLTLISKDARLYRVEQAHDTRPGATIRNHYRRRWRTRKPNTTSDDR